MQDKNLLKIMLDRIFQPDICSRTFSDLIKESKEKAYQLLEEPDKEKEFITSKLVLATKYINYSIIFSLVFFALHKLPKIEKLSIEKVKKYKIINFITELFFKTLKVSLFHCIFTVKRYQTLFQAEMLLEKGINFLFKKFILKNIHNPIINETALHAQLFIEEFLLSLVGYFITINTSVSSVQHGENSNQKKPSFQFHISMGENTKLITAYILEQIFIRFNQNENQEDNKTKLMLEE